ncbi:hypothetical protein CFK39_08995 [Brachybacterium avium]|uniref:DUF624 domain-containing protein n=1 Tax=Brachybacterium avium TaxID=2017485 RepID=A0A220UCK2_9MICO|nr:DUF624 domain-containing protein [Brachybacterium avium]ASK65938.1 hypothetical protein CFK39_08995 [Brachybacterium avium]
MTPPRRPRSLFTDLTEGVYWFLVIDVLLVLAAAPTVLLWTVMSPSALSSLLFVVAALPLLPALSAALYACRSWREERELVPARQFLRGYRLNALESLTVGTPVMLVLALAMFNLARAGSRGIGTVDIVFLVVGAAALLVLVRALSIVSRFSFRLRDVYRLTAFTLLTKPLSTLSLLSLGVLTLGIVLVIGEFLLLFTASLLVFALWASERPVAELLMESFIAPADPLVEA